MNNDAEKNIPDPQELLKKAVPADQTSGQTILPNVQVRIEGPGSATPVQQLTAMTVEATQEGNRSEERVSLQIILIDSAILAIIGGIGLSQNDKLHFSAPAAILVILSTLGLGLSLFAGVMHFILERQFWYGLRKHGRTTLNVASVVQNADDQNRAAVQAAIDAPQGSNRVAFWIQVVSFMVGIVPLIILICANIISKA
jgi:hypothetical protein